MVWLGVLPVIVAAWIGCSENTVMIPDDGVTPPPPVVDLDSIPPGTVNGLIVRSPGVRSLALQWVAPGCDDWCGIAAEYDIRFSSTPITDNNWDQALKIPRMPVPAPAGTVQKCRAIELEPATTYYFAMKSWDGHSNASQMSNVAYGTTLQETMPPSRVTDLEVSELDTGRYLLTWTARGDDGVIGQASSYEIRYQRFGMITDENWSSSARVKNVPPPKAPGEKESLILEVPYPLSNHAFAIKVSDEAANWSKLSNPGLALGSQSFMWVYPDNVAEGEEMTIVFRAPGDQHVDIELFYVLSVCGSGDVQLYSGTAEKGFYTVKFDFYDVKTNRYWDPNWYVVSACIGGERVYADQIQFTE